MPCSAGRPILSTSAWCEKILIRKNIFDILFSVEFTTVEDKYIHKAGCYQKKQGRKASHKVFFNFSQDFLFKDENFKK